VFLAALPAILGPIISGIGTAATAAFGAVSGAVTGALGAVGGTIGLTAGQTAMLGASLIGTGVSTGMSVSAAKQQNKIADQQAEVAEQAAQHEVGQANVRAQQEGESLAERQVALQRQAAEERGVMQASGLPVSSIRALVRNVEASRGRGDVAIRTNLEFAQQKLAASKTTSGLNLAGNLLTISGNRENVATAGLNAFGEGAGGAINQFASFDRTGTKPTAGERLRKSAGSLNAGSSAVSTGF
jgi:hypothetical protein